jgi:hypothetical protein
MQPDVVVKKKLLLNIWFPIEFRVADVSSYTISPPRSTAFWKRHYKKITRPLEKEMLNGWRGDNQSLRETHLLFNY